MSSKTIIGSVSVENGAITTHRDSYLLSNLSVVSVRRPFLASSVFLGAGFSGFGIAFGDLLYAGEKLSVIGLSAVAIFLGSQIGQLSLLSRDLKGSELSSAVWGWHSSLQSIRMDIVSALHRTNHTRSEGEIS
ncbi:MAG: hypothetical protein GY748_23720 [Planctomycetaceae bacterium]|nr:hypothetical protein [Planctomycetaceae bacterium]